MSLMDVVRVITHRSGRREACARYRARNLEACRARVRASKLKAKQRKAA